MGPYPGLPIAVGSEIRIEARPKADSSIRVYNSDGRIDKDGKFEIRDVLPGSYNLSLATSDDGRFSQEITTGQTVEVTNADVNGLQESRPAPSSQVRGQFRVDSGQKIDWSQTTVRLDSDEDSGGSSSSPFGGESPVSPRSKPMDLSSSRMVPAGAYHLVASSRAQALRDYFVKSVNLGSKDVSDTGFTTGGANYSLDIVVSAKGATVEGTVLEAKDRLSLTPRLLRFPPLLAAKVVNASQQEQGRPQGHVTLHGLNPGQYTVIAFEDLDDDYAGPGLSQIARRPRPKCRNKRRRTKDCSAESRSLHR